MAEFKIGRLRYTWKGQWATATFYNRDAVVQYGGKTYVCLEPHTSGDFYNDIAHVTPSGASTPYWTTMMEGRSWSGPWTPNTYYNLGQIVTYGGAVYECSEHHTSGPTIIDLTKWTLYSKTDKWTTNWATNFVYGVGDIVKYGGIVYRCIVNHTAAATAALGLEDDIDNWEIVTTGIEYKQAWATGVRYKLNDLVKNGPDLYIATAGHTSTSVFDLTKWTLWLPGQEGQDTWSSTEVYQLGDVVMYGGYSYISNTTNNTNSTPSVDAVNWDLLTTGFNMLGDWDSGTSYRVGDTVRRGGQLFTAITDSSSVDPSASAVTRIYNPDSNAYVGLEEAVGNTFSYTDPDLTGLLTFTAYPAQLGLDLLSLDIGDTITINSNVTKTLTSVFVDNAGVLTADTEETGSPGSVDILSVEVYFPRSKVIKVDDLTGIVAGELILGVGFTQQQAVVSIIDATRVELSAPSNGTPTPGQSVDFVGINGAYWELVVPGVNWKKVWAETVTYGIGDLVVWKNETYICVRNHTSTPSYRPDVDTVSAYWQHYILHARKNALTTLGDLETFDNDQYEPIHIGTNTQDFVFRATGGVPRWQYVHRIPKVYYVTPNGTDSETYGDTWDHPWKTIKYACEIVSRGYFNLNAADIVRTNKTFMVEEMYQWMLFQKDAGNSPFNSTSEFDEAKTKRDANLVLDAIVYDITRGGNSQTVAATIAYFVDGSTNTFYNDGVTLGMPYFIAALTRLLDLVEDVLGNVIVTPLYQELNEVDPELIVTQQIPVDISAELDAFNEISSLLNIVITALTDSSTLGVPSPNQGLTATIMVKTGTYKESLPISVPANVALNGDELRGVVVQPLVSINTICKQTSGSTNRFTLLSYDGIEVDTPVQFIAPVLDTIGGITVGTTYYVTSVTSEGIQVSETLGGDNILLSDGTSLGMSVVGGDAIKDMFYVRNGCGIRNMTVSGLVGTLTEGNQFTTQRPTGGSFVSLDPGTGPDDTSAWIIRKSPYIQNVTTFGTGCTGLKIDGTLHNGGNKSVVANDFTQIISDGIGVWCTGRGSLTELVSVFCYYNYSGYFAEDGGRIRATNGNSSYGTYGCIAEGYDDTETPITGLVDNRSAQVQASVQSSFGSNAQLLKLQYANAGSAYNQSTTNLLKYSNQFNESAYWSTAGSVSIQQNVAAPNGYSEAWSVTSNTSTNDTDYLYQDLSILPAGQVYSNVAGVNVSGSGVNATFDITVTGTSYIVVVNTGGSGYVTGNQILISGNQLGGANNTNDCIITVASLAGSAILTVTSTGTVPTGSDLGYIVSAHVQEDTASSVELAAVFSGSSTVYSSIVFNFDTGAITPAAATGGMTPATYGKVTLDDGWFRIWMLVFDATGLNNNVQTRIYPRASVGASGRTHVYGMQLQNSTAPTFYLETGTRLDTEYANFKVVGAGSGADIIGDELRSGSVFQTRITDTDGNGAGGSGHLTASNSAQGGNETQIILAGSDINLESNYRGMRVFINSGTGAGQYGYISAFDDEISKVAQVLRETFDEITIITSDSGTDAFGISPSQTTNDLYVGQAVQFLPTYYTTSINSVSVEEIGVSFTTGGTVNSLTVASTAKLRLNMAVTFSGTVFGGLTTDFTYYIINIINDNEIQVSTQLFGSVWALQTATPVVGSSMSLNFPTNTSYINGDTTNMVPNMPIQFTGTAMGGITVGTIYYVNDVIDGTAFTISNSVQTVTATATTVTSNEITAPTTSLITFNPIIFTGTTFGGIVEDTKYYISKIVSPTAFTVVTELITLSATATEAVTNLITVPSTVGLVANNPIQFVGTTFGGLVAETIYYVLAINDGSTFTISLTPAGSAVNLTTATGDVIVRSVGLSTDLTTASGTMTGTTTAVKTTLSQGFGTMTGTYSTSLFGGVSAGTTYYIDTFDNVSKTITVSATDGGQPFALTTKTGSMAMGAVGWDHINIGTPIEPVLDSTSLYFIEPRTAFSKPAFVQTPVSGVSLPPGSTWAAIAYGDNYWMALPSANATAAGSANGLDWTSITLPASLNWSDIAYGNGYWVAISSGGSGNSKAIRSVSHGEGWRTSNLPSATTWRKLAFGNGKFVAMAADGSVAYSSNFGGSWSNGTNFPVGTDWTGLCYGNGKFVAVQAGSTTAAYSTDGINWTTTTMPANSNWSAVRFGNGRFVAVSSTSAKSAFSFDAITWYQSNLLIAGTSITYGQGVFLVLNSSGTTAWTSEGGLHWKIRTVTSGSYSGVAFGFAEETYSGLFVTLSGQSTGSIITAGAQAKGRAVITSGVITSISQWENGSNYTSVPTVTFTDPNVTKLATVQPRIGNGTLGNPTFANRGDGYSTNSTTVTITGSGYADQFQTGLTLIVNNLTSLPGPGDNLVIAGNPNIYKVTNAVAKFGTVSPNIEANIEIAPDMNVNLSPLHAAEVTIRQKYSQVRLTGHDFLNIGYGNQLQSNYPGLPTETVLSPQNHVAEVNYGRVFYTSTDQDGDFRVGGLFAVQQATGIVTLSASQFGLTGLETLSLGGIAVGGSGVVITQFSTDQTFVANSNNVVPTQKAIKGYLTSRLSQGGSNTFTGQLIAGTVLIGGPDKISSTIPEGTAGGNVQMTNKVSVEGEFAAWGGDGAALAMFIQSWNHR